jgi:hypothetical protein
VIFVDVLLIAVFLGIREISRHPLQERQHYCGEQPPQRPCISRTVRQMILTPDWFGRHCPLGQHGAVRSI